MAYMLDSIIEASGLLMTGRAILLEAWRAKQSHSVRAQKTRANSGDVPVTWIWWILTVLGKWLVDFRTYS
jgi:hypothetical protein